MRNKGLLTILIASVFSLVVIFSLITMLSVKHIDVDFSVYNLGEEYTDDIYNELNEYKGKNITFLDLDDLRLDLSKYTYFGKHCLLFADLCCKIEMLNIGATVCT